MRLVSLAFVLAILSTTIPACVPFQPQGVAVVAPRTFNEGLLTAYVTLSGVQNLAADLFIRGRISKEDATRVYRETVALRAALDLAAPAKDAKSLEAATQALIALEAQLKARQ